MRILVMMRSMTMRRSEVHDEDHDDDEEEEEGDDLHIESTF